jgi:hypothetical protein
MTEELHRTYQSRAEQIFSALGRDGAAPLPASDESVTDYRRRICNKLRLISPRWKYIDVSSFPVGPQLNLAEEQIFADAVAAVNDPSRAAPGTLIESITTDRANRRISKFIGDPGACWDSFKSSTRGVTGIGGR